VNSKAPQKDPLDGYDLGEYRYATAKLVKLLIRARAKVEADFLNANDYKRWGLANIQDDRDSPETLVQAAEVTNAYLWNSFIGPCGSGGIRLDDPLGNLKEQVIRFSLSCEESELLAKIRRGERIDWSQAAAWDLLPAIREGLDGLPEPAGNSSANSPVVLGGSAMDDVVVLGKPKRLTKPRYDVIKALVNAFPQTLTQDQLIAKSDHSDAVGILKRLARRDPDWKVVIKLAGSTGGGYGLIDPAAD
jgi:hypothetical protein